MARYKSILFKHMKRYAKSNGLQFEVYGCFTNAHVSNHTIGTPHFHFIVYGVGASTIAQEMRAAWLKRWPNARGVSDGSKVHEKGRVYDLCDEKEGGWLGYIKKNYRMAADGLHGWACCSFGLSRKKGNNKRSYCVCDGMSQSRSKRRQRSARHTGRSARKRICCTPLRMTASMSLNCEEVYIVFHCNSL